MSATRVLNRAKWGCTSWLAALAVLCLFPSLARAGFLEIKNGYFWDTETEAYFMPHGISYQVWNPPVYATQTFAQIAYDLNEMKKMGANSLRVEFTWGEFETSEGVFDFDKSDFLIEQAEALGLRLFILIGYQFPPSWFSSTYPTQMARHYDAVADSYGQSVVLNYAHPDAKQSYADYIATVCARYKDSPAVAAWIVGNEFAYYNLWEGNGIKRFLGYDTTHSITNWRGWLEQKYSAIGSLNSAWGTAYGSFGAVPMHAGFPTNREDQVTIQNSGYNDLIRWRKQTIGEFLAAGSLAAKTADTNHMTTYSMVGGIFNGLDANNTSEDAKSIIAACEAAGAPLDFWTLNNYPWTLTGSEMRSSDFGISKYRDVIDIPVMLSETGLSDTDNLFTETVTRQAAAMPSLVWEPLMSGAIGMHIFHWSDRDDFLVTALPREAGFGIVEQDRTIKNPVFYNVMAAFRRMKEINIAQLLAGSTDPDPQVLLYWTEDADLGWNRANQENAMLWGAFRRLGYQIGIIDEVGFESNEWLNASALLLSRNFQMNTGHLHTVATTVINTGVHVHASVDLPGRFNEHHAINANWSNQMNSLFGLNVGNAVPGLDSFSGDIGVGFPGGYNNVFVEITNDLEPLNTVDATRQFGTWKIWHGVTAASGTTIATHEGVEHTQSAMPALHVKDHGGMKGKTAVNTFGIGDIIRFDGDGNPAEHPWNVRYDLLQAIYSNYFDIGADIEITGSRYVMVDRRVASNGTHVISLMNMSAAPQTVTIETPLLTGMKIENLTHGGILTTSSTGSETINLAKDEIVWLYAYTTDGADDTSLVNVNPPKLWFEECPTRVWPNGQSKTVKVEYDTMTSNLNLKVAFKKRDKPHRVYGLSSTLAVSGQGIATMAVPIAEANLGDTNYVSTMDGGDYFFHAWLETPSGLRVSDTELCTCLQWGVRPLSIETNLSVSTAYCTDIRWEDIPSFLFDELPTPLHRADVWPEGADETETYFLELCLVDGSDVVVAGTTNTTSIGTDTNTLCVTTPSTLNNPPYTWKVKLITDLTGTDHDYKDSFEDRARGSGDPVIAPWQKFVYAQNGAPTILDHGIASTASQGTNGFFMSITNHPTFGTYAGFGAYYQYSSTWALPAASEYSNIIFTCDFIETNNIAGVVEVKIEDSTSASLHYTSNYIGNGWDTIGATLDKFTTVGAFNPNDIDRIVVLFAMAQSAEHHGVFDDICFSGTPQIPIDGEINDDTVESFENRALGDQGTSGSGPAPWVLGSFGSGGPTYQNTGADTTASDGSKGSFQVYQSHTAGGNSAYYLSFTYPQSFELPVNLSTVGFSFDFLEDNGRPAVLEMQVKDSGSGVISYSNTYTHSGSYVTTHANLDQFTTGSVDVNDIKEIAVLVHMLQADTQYVGHIDFIQFTGTVTTVLSVQTNGLYCSANEIDLGKDSDSDGIPDAFETDTDTFLHGRDTGTDPNDSDSDNDGVNDGDEVIAGTDPNNGNDLFAIEFMECLPAGATALSWMGLMDRIYCIEVLDGSLVTNSFQPLQMDIRTSRDGMIDFTDTSGNGTNRHYRLRAKPE